MVGPSFSQNLVIFLLAAFLGGLVAKKLGAPILVGYLLAGVAFKNLAEHFGFLEMARVMAQIGVVLLLFTIGLEFSLSRIKELGEIIILGTLVQILLTIVSILFFFPIFGFNFYESLFLGTAFSLSSTAVGLKILSDKGELETLHGEISSGWLFMQDLYTLPLIVVLSTLAFILKGEENLFSSLVATVRSLFFAFILFSSVFYIGKHFVPFLMEKVANFQSRELLLIGAMLFCLFIAYLFELLGLSYALGAFMAGMILSSSSSRHGIFAEIRPLRDLFASVFFVSLGFMIEPAFLFSFFPKIFILTILVLAIKFFISFFLIFLLGFHPKVATLSSFSLVSVGEFAFILALIGSSSRIISQEVFTMIVSVSFFTLIFAIPLIFFGDKFYYQITLLMKKKFPQISFFLAKIKRINEEESEDFTNHVVVLGHGRVGKYICQVLANAEIPYLVVDYNHRLVKSLREKGVKVIYGDPAEIDVLEYAKLKEAQAVILAYADRYTQEMVIANILTLNPKIKIICRSHFDEDQRKLKSLGVDAVVQPEFEAAIVMAEKLLCLLYKETKNIEEKLRKLRSYQGLE